MGMATTTEEDRKKEHYYPFVGIIRDDGTVGTASHQSWGFELDINGSVYPAKHRRALKIATSEVWYALISKNRHTKAWLVRSNKLHRVREIEALRWRALLKVQAQVATFDDVYNRSRALGRIWCYDTRREFTEPRFIVWDDRNRWRSHRATPEDLLGNRTSAVDRLAILATPEEEALGALYDSALNRLGILRSRVAMIDEILSTALRVCGVHKTHYEPQLERNVTSRYRTTINGRVYYQIGSETGYGYDEQRVWPNPSDNIAKF